MTDDAQPKVKEEKNLLDWYWSEHLALDFVFAVVIFTLICVVGHRYHLSYPLRALLHGTHASLYSALLSSYGTLLGFIITAATFSAGFIDHKAFEDLKKNGSFCDVFSIYGQGAFAISLGFLTALVGIVCDTDTDPKIVITMANVFILLLMIFRIWKCVWVVQKLADIQLHRQSNLEQRANFRSHIDE